MSDQESTNDAQESATPTDDEPPHELAPPSAPETAPPVTPAPRLWHQFCNRTHHFQAISDLPTSLPLPES